MAEAYISIDTKTGSMVLFDETGDVVGESKRKPADRTEFLEMLFAICYKTGVDKLEFLSGGKVEVLSAKAFFAARTHFPMLTGAKQ